MAAPKNRGLGRGLEALFGDVEIQPVEEEKPVKKTSAKETPSAKKTVKEKEDADSVRFININDIKPNENQPRKTFNEEKIADLAASILEHGLIQPIVVRKAGKGYEIVAGERRYRAARKAGLKTIPCLVRELTDEQNMLLAIIENVQREDLNPIEEAEAIDKMIETYGLTQEQVSKSLSKSRPYITNSLRLLKLCEEVRAMVAAGSLSAGHARALVSVKSAEKQLALATKAVKEGLSVRDIERLSGESKAVKPVPRKRRREADVVAVEEELKDTFGTKVNLKGDAKKGKIEIEYYSREELDRILEILRACK